MLSTFRQGLIRVQTTPPFLSLGVGGVTLNASTDPTIVAFAHGKSDYLFTESETIVNAWAGTFNVGTDYHLYWDIDLYTGERTFGYTTLAPSFGTSLPISPNLDEHFFDLNDYKMKVWNGSSWKTKIRVFAGVVQNGAILIPLSDGSQVNLNQTRNIGHILFDDNGNPVKRFDRLGRGDFLTTESGISSQDIQLNSYKLEALQIAARAVEPAAKYHCLSLKGPNRLGLASYLEPNYPCVGISVEDINKDEVRRFVTDGFITNEAWNFTESPNTPIWVGSNGEITTVVPSNVSMQRIGHLVDHNTVFIDIQEIILINPIPVTPTPTPSVTASLTVTPTPTISVTPSPTISVTPSITVSVSPTPTVTPTASVSTTPGITPTTTPGITPTTTPTVTPTVTPSPSTVASFPQALMVGRIGTGAVVGSERDKILRINESSGTLSLGSGLVGYTTAPDTLRFNVIASNSDMMIVLNSINDGVNNEQRILVYENDGTSLNLLSTTLLPNGFSVDQTYSNGTLIVNQNAGKKNIFYITGAQHDVYTGVFIEKYTVDMGTGVITLDDFVDNLNDVTERSVMGNYEGVAYFVATAGEVLYVLDEDDLTILDSTTNGNLDAFKFVCMNSDSIHATREYELDAISMYTFDTGTDTITYQGDIQGSHTNFSANTLPVKCDDTYVYAHYLVDGNNSSEITAFTYDTGTGTYTVVDNYEIPLSGPEAGIFDIVVDGTDVYVGTQYEGIILLAFNGLTFSALDDIEQDVNTDTIEPANMAIVHFPG